MTRRGRGPATIDKEGMPDTEITIKLRRQISMGKRRSEQSCQHASIQYSR